MNKNTILRIAATIVALGTGVTAMAMMGRGGGGEGPKRPGQNSAPRSMPPPSSRSSSSATVPVPAPVPVPASSPSSSSSSTPVVESKAAPFKEPKAISILNPDSKALSPWGGLEAKTSINLKGRLAARTGTAIDNLTLGDPSIFGNRLLVGTDNPNGTSNWLLCMDPTMGDMRRDPILGYLPFAGPVSSAEWIHPQLALVAEGDGHLHLIHITPANELKLHGSLPPIHTSALRQIAVNTVERATFASGGYDRKLCLVNLEHPEAMQTIPQDGVIGSVTWPLCNQNVCPSLTLDDGTFLIYDTRVSPVGPPALRATMGKKELFAHTRYTDHNALLGFGDGEIQHIDVRVTDRILQKIKDPHVTAIGSLEYNFGTNLLLVGG